MEEQTGVGSTSSPLSCSTKSILPALTAAASTNDLKAARGILSAWDACPHPFPAKGSKDSFYKLSPALQTALLTESLDVAAYFLKAGFRIYKAVVDTAVTVRSIEGLELLLAHGWDINDRTHGYFLPPICKAVATASTALIIWFLAHGATPNPAQNGYASTTPLTVACARSIPSVSLVQLLLSHGADPSKGNLLHTLSSDQTNPLYSKLRLGNPERLQLLNLLVDAGAPLDELQDQSNPKRFKISSKKGYAGTPLHRAIERRDEEIARALVRRGADTRIKDCKGRTAGELAGSLKWPVMENVIHNQEMIDSDAQSHIAEEF